ncbi:hypothetical protein KY311_02745 [Candidatus Woesearchaeota archaeon]|nr:hypothetical protein [Candidatus Woesearchaeota archaeon]MBW3016969.1 hypothetical protein [Candidatus Woesearchaeota archaeon]
MKKKYSGKIPKITVTYKGVFAFDTIYELVRDFLVENGFVDIDFPQSGGKPDMWEKRYLEKGSPVTGYWINWETKKVPENNTYYRYILNISFQGVAVSQVDVMEAGKKVTRHKGEININIEGEVQTDFNKEWENHWLLKHFKNTYDNKIMKEEFKDMHEATLYKTMYRLQSVVKRYFKLMGGHLAPEKTAPVIG